MSEFIILLTNACILITFNYVALKIKNKRFIESNTLFIVPILTGISSIFMMLQLFPSDFQLDLGFVPIIMAGLLFGLTAAVLSALIPSIYLIIIGSPLIIFELSLGLLLPAVISAFYHRKEYRNGHSLIQLTEGIKICIIYFFVSTISGYYLIPVTLAEWVANSLLLLLISSAIVLSLTVMYNDENKAWTRQRELELQANQDGLTKLPNRRSFMDICMKFLKKERISILMIDIDYFKNYNDCHGHQKGDQLLREIGVVLSHSIGEKDYLARYGGEEFIIMCHTCNVSHLNQLGQYLCKRIADYPFEGREVQVNQLITISVGISIASKVNDDMYRIISEADDALYASKNAGRNQSSISQIG